MLGELNDSFFTQYGKFYSAYNMKNNMPVPFKGHLQFSLLVDILSRKNCHHGLLYANFPHKMRVCFLEAFLQHLTHEHIPHFLRDAELIYLDPEHLPLTQALQKNIEKDMRALLDGLDMSNKYLLFAFPSFKALKGKKAETGFMRRQLNKLMHHPNCRFLVFADPKDYQDGSHNEHFSLLELSKPSDADVIMLLKQQRAELENFHHILIPEELLSDTLALAERYLNTHEPLASALLLLDSAAARASTIDRGDTQFKPVLTTATLGHVLSGWTQIPDSHLHLARFKLSEFTQGMQQRLFGQDAAISLIAQKLQQAHARLQMKTGPFCSLLFAGAKHSGKKTAALALAEQLFKQVNMLYFAQPGLPNLNSIMEIKLEGSMDKRYADLKDVIRKMPYAIIVFEDIDEASPVMLDGLHEILSTGLYHDNLGNEYNFRQAIILLTTTLGEHRLHELAKSYALDDETSSGDLMQLVMREEKSHEFSVNQHCSPQELIDEIFSELANVLSQTLVRYAHIVPFLPLTKSSIEKIIYLKIKMLSKELESRYGIELSYAPEVIRYLADEVLVRPEDEPADTEKAIKQVYFCVEQAILSQADSKHKPTQLFLQLNETGQMLRCDWSSMPTDITRWSMNKHRVE